MEKLSFKRCLSLLLCLTMFFTCVQFSAIADGLSGTSQDGSPAAEPVPEEEPEEEPEEPAAEPAGEPVKDPADGPAEDPADDPAEDPADGPAEDPADGPAEDPADDPAEEPAEQIPADEAWTDPVTADSARYPFTFSYAPVDLGNTSYDGIGYTEIRVKNADDAAYTTAAVVYWGDAPVEISVEAGAAVRVDCRPDREKDAYIRTITYVNDIGEDEHTYGEGDGIDEVGGDVITMPACDASMTVAFDVHEYLVNTVTDPDKYFYDSDIGDYCKTGTYVNVTAVGWPGWAVTGVAYSWESDGETVTEQAERVEAEGALTPVYRFVMPAGSVSVSPVAAPTYPVTAAEAAHGRLTVSPAAAAEGETVTVTAEPDGEFRLGLVFYTPEGGARTRISPDGDGRYTFVMPDAAVIVEAEFDPDNAWQRLQDEIDRADGTTVVLSDDITATADNYELTFGMGRSVTLDLNGHTLSRGMPGASDTGCVILVTNNSTVTVTDSRGGGTITGGKSARSGGGICVSSGSLTLAGGTVSGNTAENGGGVYVDGGSFTLAGGTVSGNTAEDRGGGVYVRSGGITLAGGTVSGNTAPMGAGIYPETGVSITVAEGSVIRVSDALCLGIGMSAAVTGTPAEGSLITVSLLDTAARNNPVVIATSPVNCASVFAVESQQSNTEVAWDNGAKTVVLQMTSAVLTWAELQEAMSDGGECIFAEPENYYMIRLGADITAGSGDAALTFDYFGHPVYLDLCGHTVSRGLTSPAAEGNVLTVERGTLILTDSEGGGRLTGGCSLGSSGSGVIVNGGTFVMEGGSITGNTIKDVNGAGLYLNGGTFHMKGGSITGNTAIDCEGAGLYLNGGTLLLSGSPVITGNTCGGNASNVFLGSGSISLAGALTEGARVGVGSWRDGRFTDDTYTAWHDGEAMLGFFAADSFFRLYRDADGHPCLESAGHSDSDEPVWNWTDTPLPVATMICRNCGGTVWTEEASVGDPVWNADRGVFVFAASVEKYGRTYTAAFSREPVLAEQIDPSVDADGRYVPGTAAHYELTWGGETRYFTRDPDDPARVNLTTPEELALCWFDFSDNYIVRYTGPILPGTQNDVEVPKYAPAGNTPLTSLGDGERLFVNARDLSDDTRICFTDRGNITLIHSLSFINGRNVTLTLNGESTIQVASNAFSSCSGVMIRCRHASRLGWGAYNDTTGVYTVEYLDPHRLTAAAAEVADDFSEATLTIRCDVETCGFETTVDGEVDVKSDPDHSGDFLVTVKAAYEGQEYSISLPVGGCFVAFNVNAGTTSERYVFRIPKAVHKDCAVFRPADLNLPEIDPPAGAAFAGWKKGGETFASDALITVSGDTTEFTAEWESSWAAVREALLEPDACVYLYNSIEAGPEDLPLSVPAGSQAVLILHGFDVNRNLTTAVADGYAIRVDGTLYVNHNPVTGETFSGGTVKGGRNTASGGGILVRGTLNIRSASVSGNDAGANGGAVCVAASGSAVLTSVTAVDNRAVNGGAVFVGAGGSLEMNGSGFHNNSASGDGGGIYIADGGSASLSGGEITYCAAAGKGGGVYVGGDAEVAIDDNTQPEAHANGRLKPRVVITGFVIAACTIAFCVAGAGGGVFFNKGTVSIGPGTRIINNTNPSDTFDNLQGNPSNSTEIQIPRVDPNVPIELGIPLTAAAAGGGAAGGMAGWLQALLAAGALAVAGGVIGGIIYYFTRDKENDSDRQDQDCTHPGWETEGLFWDDDAYAYVDEFLRCTQCSAHRYNRLTPAVNVNSSEQTVYTVTASDGSGTTDNRIVEPFELLMTTTLFQEQMAEIRLRFAHNRGAGYTHALPSASPWSFSPSCINFQGWELGDDSVTAVDFRDKDDDGRTKTVVAKWTVPITYASGALVEAATIVGEPPQNPNPTWVPLASEHILKPCTWQQYVLFKDRDGSDVKVFYVFYGWDVSTGVRFIDGFTPDYIFEAVTGLPGKQAGIPIGPVNLPTMIKAKWKSPWSIMGDALNKVGTYILPDDTYAVQLDASITVSAPEGGEGVLNLNGHKAHVYGASSAMNAFTVKGLFRITDTVGGGCVSGGKNTKHGGGINVTKDGRLTLEGVTVRENVCLNPMVTGSQAFIPANGGGMYVGGTLIMNGGSIRDNETSCSGGGVYVDSGALFRMNGGEITGNEARFIREDQSFLGGGVYVNGTFEVSGRVTILNNKRCEPSGENKDNNVYLPAGRTITVAGKLDASSRIGVSMAEPGVITGGLNANGGESARGTAANFVSDDPAYMVVINGDGEAELVTKKVRVTFEKGDENARDKDDQGNDLMPDDEADRGSEYMLPACRFGEPEGKVFDEWQIRVGGESGEPRTGAPGTGIAADGDIVLTTLWRDALAFRGHAILLSGDIGLQFFLELPPEKTAADYEGGYVTFTRNGAEEPAQMALSEAPHADGRYLFQLNLSSIQMADLFVPTFHWTDDEGEKTVTGDAYSVEKYILWAKGDGAAQLDARQLNIIGRLADYGHYAQPYLSAQNNWTIGEKYAEMKTRYTESYDRGAVLSATESSAFVMTAGSADVADANYRLTMGSQITLSVRIKPAEGAALDTVTVDGNPTAVTLSGGYYMVKIPNLYANQLADEHTITAGDCTIRVSPASFVYEMLGRETSSAELKDLLCALYWFADACSADD